MEILEQRSLDNGMSLTLSDLSRKVAGDRWLVRVVWEAVIPVAEDLFSRLPETDPLLHSAVREGLGQSITFSVARERNFVADGDRAAMVDSLRQQGLANMLSYLSSPLFPEKLFLRRYEEETQACLLARHLAAQQQERDSQAGDDGEPADFSACFRKN